MTKTTTRSALALAIALASGQVFANGLSINEQSASSAGTAYAGRSSSAHDASTVFGNPAGMSKLDRTEVVGGLAVIHAKTDISDVQTTAAGSSDGDMVPDTAIPFGYVVTPLNDRWHFGLGVYVPFGVISDYEDAFQGASHGLYSKVQVITVQPTLSYKFNDRVSIGFGPTINRIDGKLTNTLTTGGLPPIIGGTGSDAKVNIKGDDIAYGYNVGILVDATEHTRVGLTYHSKVDFKLDGRTRITGLPNLGAPIGLPLGTLANGTYDASLDITMPESVDISLTHELNDQWTLYAGTTWTRWSRLDALNVVNEGVNPIAAPYFGTVSEALNWEDTWSFAVGASYQLNAQWVLRTGLAIDPSPTSNDDRTVRIPVGNRKTFTLGAGWSPNADLTVDLAYAYLWENKAGVNTSGTELSGLPIQPAYSATYENSAHGLVAGLTYRF